MFNETVIIEPQFINNQFLQHLNDFYYITDISAQTEMNGLIVKPLRPEQLGLCEAAAVDQFGTFFTLTLTLKVSVSER